MDAVPYAVVREAKKAARNTGTKSITFTEHEGSLGKFVCKDGRGTTKASGTVALDGTTKFGTKPIRKERKPAATPEPEAQEDAITTE